MTDTTRPDLDAIDARANAATAGEWVVGYFMSCCSLKHFPHGQGACDYRVYSHTRDEHNISVYVPNGTPSKDAIRIAGNYDYEEGGIINENDAAFIAAAREDVPTLTRYARELERAAADRDAEVERLQCYAEYADIDRRMAEELREKDAEIEELRRQVRELHRLLTYAADDYNP